ncbi:MAG: hypothetical protein M3Y08_17505 [Fibrobacterota bacterium]|nr:hypothetical protein [Fibrobacterota bacterium]
MNVMNKPGLLLTLALLIPLAACNKKASEKADPDKTGSSPSEAQAAGSNIPAKPPVEGELVITAKVLNIPGSLPANDLYSYAYVMKYQVLKVVQGSYPDTEILIGHYNPRMARSEVKDEQDPKVGGNVKSFQVGDVHYLVLSPLDGTWTGATEDDYFKEKRPRYWALWADKAE